MRRLFLLLLLTNLTAFLGIAQVVPCLDLSDSANQSSVGSIGEITLRGVSGNHLASVLLSGIFDSLLELESLHMIHPTFGGPFRGNPNHGSADHGTLDDGRLNHGSTDNGSTDNGSTDHGSTDHGITEHVTSNHDSADHGSPDHGSTDHGSAGYDGSDFYGSDLDSSIAQIKLGSQERLREDQIFVPASRQIASALGAGIRPEAGGMGPFLGANEMLEVRLNETCSASTNSMKSKAKKIKKRSFAATSDQYVKPLPVDHMCNDDSEVPSATASSKKRRMTEIFAKSLYLMTLATVAGWGIAGAVVAAGVAYALYEINDGRAVDASDISFDGGTDVDPVDIGTDNDTDLALD
eukprot:g14784.t1